MAKLFSTVLKPGSKGPAVNVLGLWLKLQGWDGKGREEINLDGDFTPGGAIENSLKLYQTQSNLEQTGELDEATLEEMKNDSGLDVAEFTTEMFSGETTFA